MNRRIFSFVAIFLILTMVFSTKTFAAKDHNFKMWQDIARAMGKEFDLAQENIAKKDGKAAYKNMNNAYFRYYETTGFEAYVGNGISSKRVNIIESAFRDIKQELTRANFDVTDLKKRVLDLKYKVYRDAMVLDGVAEKDSPDSLGKAIDGKENVVANSSNVWWKDFWVSFGLLLREGLEALLVVVAIVTYLIKTGNKHLVKGVGLGVLGAVVFSVILAIVINVVVGGAGTSQELIEGLTMFIAVGVLFYVSNWMLHKSEEAEWEAYIHSQVTTSINKQSYRALIFASFIAVVREGAELVLFYQASFSGGRSQMSAIVAGIGVATVILLVVWLIFRYTTIKIPLKPFFTFTSILLFIMCISFVGKGVQELTEAGFIIGATSLPFMNGFQIPDLGIFDRAETLLPQLILIIASIWMILSHRSSTKRKIRDYQKNNIE